MPVFTKLDTSLKERIVVINFPYTFKAEEDIDPTNPTHKPIDVSLKNEFDKEIYKTAMVSLLFEYYRQYKADGLIIPKSVKSYTKIYFEEDSIKGWMDENLEPSDGSIELREITTLFEQATDKKLTFKQLKKELEDLGFTVSRGAYGFALKNWKRKTVEIENVQENDIIEEEDNEFEEE